MSGYFLRPPRPASEVEILAHIKAITARMDGWACEIRTELLAKRYNPHQPRAPRAPRGTPIGGQWVDSGGGESDGRLGIPKPARDAWVDDAMIKKPPHQIRPNEIL